VPPCARSDHAFNQRHEVRGPQLRLQPLAAGEAVRGEADVCWGRDGFAVKWPGRTRSRSSWCGTSETSRSPRPDARGVRQSTHDDTDDDVAAALPLAFSEADSTVIDVPAPAEVPALAAGVDVIVELLSLDRASAQ
jgi:hypothetical protein